MAETRLSATRDAVQPVCEEYLIDEPDERPERKAEMDHHRQGYLEHDSGPYGNIAWRTCS